MACKYVIKCEKKATHNFLDFDHAVFCIDHKREGMIDINNKNYMNQSPNTTERTIQEIIGGKVVSSKILDIPGYTKYRVSEYGNVYSETKAGKFKPPKLCTRANGWKYVSLYNNGKKQEEINIHILVAKVFLPVEIELENVRHKDNNFNNNHYSNLEWSGKPKESNIPRGKTVPVPGHDAYIISEYGEVFYTRYGKLFRFAEFYKANGCKYVKLNNCYENIHMLVARAFIPIEIEMKYVNHIDDDFENNHYSNLEWTDSIEENLPGEIWKEIPDYPKYKASTHGRIRSYYPELPKILSLYKDDDGYLTTKMYNSCGERKGARVNRILGITFIPNPDNLPIIDHIDNDRTNNHLSNLRWVTRKENSENKVETVTGKAVKQLDKDGNLIEIHGNTVLASNKVGACLTSIRSCAKGILNTAGGYRWEYVKCETPYILQEGEISVPIVGTFDGEIFNSPKHKITNFGNVLNEKEYKLKPDVPGGYPCIFVCENNVRERVRMHILVALLFVPGRTDEKCFVNHIDENKGNHYKNLEWVTRSENAEHSSHKVKKPVYQIDKKTGEIIRRHDSMKEAATCLGSPTSAGNISGCCSGIKKSALGFKWEYAPKIVKQN